MPDIKSALSAALLRAPAPVYTNPVVQKTIKEWDDEGEKHFPINISVSPVQIKPVQTPMTTTKKQGRRVINNVMGETFNCIKTHPGLRNKDIATIMVEKGFKASSVTSVPSQLLHSGQVERRDMRYYALADEYQSIKLSDKRKVSALKKQVSVLKKIAKSKGIADLPVQKPVQGLAALAAAPAPAPAPMTMPVPAPMPAPAVKEFDPEAILNPLTVYQARALYNELKAMFGG